MVKRWLTSKELIDRWQAEPFEILEAHKNGLPFYVIGKIVTYPLNSEDQNPEKLNSAQRRELEKRLREFDEYLLNKLFLEYEPIYDPWEQAMGEDVEVAKFKLTDIEVYEKKHGISPDAEAIKEDIQKHIDVEAYEEKHEISPVDVVTDETKQKDIFPKDDISFPDVTRWQDITIGVVIGGDPYARGIEIKLPGKDEMAILYEDLNLLPDSGAVKILELLANEEDFNDGEAKCKYILSRKLNPLFKEIFPNANGNPIVYNKTRDTYLTKFKIKTITD